MSSVENEKNCLSRVWSIMQFPVNPKSGEDLHFNEDIIKSALEHKTIEMWAYICHDKDVYSEEDELKDPTHKQGDIKPVHYHVTIKCTQAIDRNTVANWFNIPSRMCRPKKGKSTEFKNKGVFFDLAFYMTHKGAKQQKQGKHVYDFSELHSSDNFDLQKELREIKSLTFTSVDGNVYTDKFLFYRHECIYNGLSRLYLRDNDQDFYEAHFSEVRSWRSDYLYNSKKPPCLINIYICGNAGRGKDIFSRSLARLLARGAVSPFDELPPLTSEYMEVGGDKVTYDTYDGQRVIIWSDLRSKTMIRRYAGFSNILSTFDVIPHDNVQNVKYGTVNLINQFYIVNSAEDFFEFVERLSQNEDKNQLYRRFPIYINFSTTKKIEIYYNYAFFNRTFDFERYEPLEVKNNALSSFVGICGEDSFLFRQCLNAFLSSLKVKVDEAINILTSHSMDIDELEKLFISDFPEFLDTWESYKEMYGTGDELKYFLAHGPQKQDSDSVPEGASDGSSESSPDTDSETDLEEEKDNNVND